MASSVRYRVNAVFNALRPLVLYSWTMLSNEFSRLTDTLAVVDTLGVIGVELGSGVVADLNVFTVVHVFANTLEKHWASKIISRFCLV